MSSYPSSLRVTASPRHRVLLSLFSPRPRVPASPRPPISSSPLSPMGDNKSWEIPE
ncbi:MAG: hypothetical protein SWY16_10020 [Cyanobacteriota bacterium]|nr:hypothetical protein [Cyanobacteriota bacterium]